MSGETDQIAGRIKQAAGDLTNDEQLEREGETQENAGKLKDAVDDVKDKANDAIDKVMSKLN
ncbi:MAG: CsbD family protein [Acidimicrobiales bacterium]